jgi:hypothetical protein
MLVGALGTDESVSSRPQELSIDARANPNERPGFATGEAAGCSADAAKEVAWSGEYTPARPDWGKNLDEDETAGRSEEGKAAAA